jgi:hypothetical protein
MPCDIKSFQQIRDAIEKLDDIASSIQELVTDAPPGLINEQNVLEDIRRQIEAVGANVIQRTMAPPTP